MDNKVIKAKWTVPAVTYFHILLHAATRCIFAPLWRDIWPSIYYRWSSEIWSGYLQFIVCWLWELIFFPTTIILIVHPGPEKVSSGTRCLKREMPLYHPTCMLRSELIHFPTVFHHPWRWFGLSRWCSYCICWSCWRIWSLGQTEWSNLWWWTQAIPRHQACIQSCQFYIGFIFFSIKKYHLYYS